MHLTFEGCERLRVAAAYTPRDKKSTKFSDFFGKIFANLRKMAEKGFAEDRMGQKIDRCFSDAVIKAGE